MESINVLGRTGLGAALTAFNIASLRSEMLMSQLCAKVVLDRLFHCGDCSSALTPYQADVAGGEAVGVSIYEYKSATFVLVHEYVQAQRFLKAPAKAAGNRSWVMQSGMAKSGAIFS